MRIHGPKVPGLQPNVTKTEESDSSKQSKQAGEAKEAVVVSIGSVASRLSTEPGSSASEAIKARLEEVRSQLGSGLYPIDYDRLAESILADDITRTDG